MQIVRWAFAALMGLYLFVGPAAADEKKKPAQPWQKAHLNLGWYWAKLDSSIRLGGSELGVGIDFDVEEFLNLKSRGNAFRVDAGWRFSKNNRHRVEFSWFSFRRSGSENIDEEIEIPIEGDDPIVIGPGELNSVFNFDIYKLKYEYSFVLDDRLDWNLGLGLFIMPIEFGVSGAITGLGEKGLLESLTAPLPVLGMGFDFAITPKLFVRTQADFFYLKYKNFEGAAFNYVAAIEYLPFKHIGFGLGLDTLRVELEAEGNPYPGIDFTGRVEFQMIGAQLYLKIYM